MDTYAVVDGDEIVELHLGPVTVTWATLGERVNVRITSGSNSILVYSSPTGRSLRAFSDNKELK
jgi:hypothetical protein